MARRISRAYQRPIAAILKKRLAESRRFIQVVAGARQVGKTTMVRQVLEAIGAADAIVSADEPTLRDREWLVQQWNAARIRATSPRRTAFLAIDEIQKVEGWAETVKRLWDEDSASRVPLKVILLGSAPLLVQRGLSESLAGRFETVHLSHWSFAEMSDAFGFDLSTYLRFGGYPGAASLVDDPQRWMSYIKDSLIETTIARDVLLMTRIDKPALLRRLFELSCRASGQILSYTKMLGQLQDAGNTTTLAHYLDTLAGAGMVAGLQKYAGHFARQRGSSPKLQVFNNALLAAQTGINLRPTIDPETMGRIVESAIGAHLLNAASAGKGQLFYWREGDREVDFVFSTARGVTAIEVKSGVKRAQRSGMQAFADAFKPRRSLLVGADGIPIEEFLYEPVEHWVV